jgi:hypothetical protein
LVGRLAEDCACAAATGAGETSGRIVPYSLGNEADNVVIGVVVRNELSASDSSNVGVRRHLANVLAGADTATDLTGGLRDIGCARVARGDENRLSLGRGLREDRIQGPSKERRGCVAILVADAYGPAGIIGHRSLYCVLQREGLSTDVNRYRCTRRDRMRPFDVDQGFGIGRADTWIRTLREYSSYICGWDCESAVEQRDSRVQIVRSFG